MLISVSYTHLDVYKRQGRHIEIPVIYGGELGQDLSEVAKLHNTTPKKIVQMHSDPIYTVYMIGFQPGFPYLGGLPECLHTPRRATPRTVVPAGSVGIGCLLYTSTHWTIFTIAMNTFYTIR